MNVLILGGDGYLGWPTAMRFSAKGHKVTVVDNYFRRNAAHEVDISPLYEVPNLVQRTQIWRAQGGSQIDVVIGDLADAEVMRGLLRASPPDVVVHYAEQPSAPYSLLDYQRANFTLTNNLLVTNNLMFAVRDLAPTCHIIKLGTMGEYGTPNIDIEEGWLEVVHKGRKERFLYPRQASSLYHTTKIMDTDLLWFGVRTWGLRVTDLMQGPVYGVETEESSANQELRTLFNYDEIFGTVLNRFITQAVVGYPLTCYGKGGQTRGYLNVQDTLQCIYVAASNPAKGGELRIFNQITETFTVNELAELTCRVGRRMGFDVAIQHIENPRKEKEEHYYNPTYRGLRDLGVTPHLLTEDVMASMFNIVAQHKARVRRETIFRGVRW